MKKIISPQDLPDQNVMQAPSVPVMLDDAEEVPTAGVDIEDTNVMGDEGGVQQQNIRQDETVAVAGGGIPGDSVEPDMQTAEERIDSHTRSPIRPQRTRRPNVRYSQDEYDLTTISGHSRQAGISGLSVRRYRGQSGGIESRTLGLTRPLPTASGLGRDKQGFIFQNFLARATVGTSLYVLLRQSVS